MTEKRATLQYRCRMCEEVIHEGYRDAEKVRLQLMNLLITESTGMPNVNQAGRYTIHYHSNGTIGFCELIGMQILDENH